MGFVGLYTGLTGVRASQVGIDVTSHNVANAATPGYTRQRVEFTARASFQHPAGQIGTGVDISQIGRLRDTFLDGRARTAFGDLGTHQVRADLLGRLEALTGEPDGGISVRLGALWTAAETWANDPGDGPARRQVLAELGATADTFRSVSAQWDALAADVATQRDVRVTAANDALQALADLDVRIANADPNRVGTDVFDQRDRLLDEVATLIGGQVAVGTDGRATVVLDGVELLDGGAATLSVTPDGTLAATTTDGTTHALGAGLGGELGGLVRVATVDLPAWRGELSALAATLADTINDINVQGVRADGTPGVELLTYDPTDPAGSIKVATTSLADLAAATTGTPPAPFDGTNAQRFADLRHDGVAGGASIDERFAELVIGLAGDVRSAKAGASASRAVAVGASLARDAEHGVSLDEEMVGLIRYQRALEAASRVMTTVDEALNVLINRTGVVGR
ncbi:flagellar hook-associated protein FlgK [Nitriliruptoraceae bacterium ZYF776]|nr:flagellar hook-associated protein FlgK [Profundirhabdus halotolerans]